MVIEIEGQGKDLWWIYRMYLKEGRLLGINELLVNEPRLVVKTMHPE